MIISCYFINYNLFNAGRKREIGRPKLKWGDSVHRDMKLLGERKWEKLALNKEEWRKLLKKARARTGLSSQ
jgi:hypothetical protein